MLELKVRVININLPENHVVLQKCRPLYEYSWLIQRIKEYLAQGRSRDEAVIQAVKDSQQEGILADFVKKYGAEVETMLFTQFDMDEALEANREEGWEEGHRKGREEGHKKGQEEGREEGAARKIIEQVIRKIQKGKTVEEMAEDLEEDTALIGRICAAVEKCGCDLDTVYVSLKAES